MRTGRELGLSEVRIGCYSSNRASIGVIERCGGRLVEEKDYLNGNPMLIFELSTSPAASTPHVKVIDAVRKN